MEAKALFLDRDGVINIDHGYVCFPEYFQLVPGIIDLCRRAQNQGYLIIVITNQSGIGRGMYSEETFEHLTAYMRNLFADAGITITDVYHCPSVDDCHPDRKPNPGLFFRAKHDHHIDMASSMSLGDKERDVQAALAAGVGRNVLFSSEQGPTQASTRIRSLDELLREGETGNLK